VNQRIDESNLKERKRKREEEKKEKRKGEHLQVQVRAFQASVFPFIKKHINLY